MHFAKLLFGQIIFSLFLFNFSKIKSIIIKVEKKTIMAESAVP